MNITHIAYQHDLQSAPAMINSSKCKTTFKSHKNRCLQNFFLWQPNKHVTKQIFLERLPLSWQFFLRLISALSTTQLYVHVIDLVLTNYDVISGITVIWLIRPLFRQKHGQHFLFKHLLNQHYVLTCMPLDLLILKNSL